MDLYEVIEAATTQDELAPIETRFYEKAQPSTGYSGLTWDSIKILGALQAKQNQLSE